MANTLRLAACLIALLGVTSAQAQTTSAPTLPADPYADQQTAFTLRTYKHALDVLQTDVVGIVWGALCKVIPLKPDAAEMTAYDAYMVSGEAHVLGLSEDETIARDMAGYADAKALAARPQGCEYWIQHPDRVQALRIRDDERLRPPK